ncbi:MAG: SCP2 sterol-binding domain-containing protein [Thermoplasmata archaeon]|nr:SCP2 sterol-binding domain-containing protein [Thermoplasmata archaeon]
MQEKFIFPSIEWVEEYCKSLNNSKAYNKEGQGWQDPILFKIIDYEKFKDKIQFDSFLLYLKNGKCEKYEIKASVDAPFKLYATYENWIKIMKGKVNPIQAIIRGELKVEGNMAILMKYTNAAVAMVNAAQNIPTDMIL